MAKFVLLLVVATALASFATAFLNHVPLGTSKAAMTRSTIKMADEPWFAEAVATNLVDKAALDKAFANAAKRSQDFLEADPYYDQSGIPLNTYSNKAPLIGKVISCKRIVGANAPGETCHIIIDHGGKMPYWEGQSYGILPPGINPKNGKPNSVRLYSIASSRYGDDMTGNTVSLCVRRATYWDPELGREDPAKKVSALTICVIPSQGMS